VRAEQKHLRHREPHLLGGIVEQQRQRGLGLAAILESDIVAQIGPRKRGGRGRPLGDLGVVDPFEKVTDDH
jgi:hypothetical protein